MIVHHDVEQGTDKWHALRDPLYTGSNADKLLKNGAGSYALAKGSGFKGNFFTRRGHTLEDEAIELYQQIKREVGIRLEDGRRVGFVTNTKYPTCGYSPDDIYPDRTIECKAFNEAGHMAMFNGLVPLKVLAQCHFGMLVCGVRICHLIIYNPDLEAKYAFKIIVIKWNPAIAANFRRKLAV